MRYILPTVALIAGAIAGPVDRLEARNPVPSPAPSSATTTTGGSTIASSTTTGTKTATSISVTLYQNAAQKFLATPITAPPATGCAIASLSATTFTTDLSTTTATDTWTAGIGCLCAGGVEYSTSVSVNNYGTKYIYCETGGAGGTPVSTNAPQASAGNPLNPDWANVSCSYGSLPSIFNNPWLQWNDSGAEAAWNDVVEAWNQAGSPQDEGFPNFVADYFHAAPNINCDELGDQYCSSPINCGQHASPNAPVSSPAGYVIINSMISIHAVLQNFYGNVFAAVSFVNGNVGEFISTFSPVNQLIADEMHEKTVFDSVNIALGFIFGFSFGSWFKATEFAKQNPNYLAVAGSILGSDTTATFTFIKDSLTLTSTLPTQNNISQFADNVGLQWLKSTQTIATGIFGNTTSLGQLLDQGKMLTDRPNNTAVAETETLIQALFANIIGLTWTTGVSSSQPFIASAAGLTSASSATSGDCQGYNPFECGTVNCIVTEYPSIRAQSSSLGSSQCNVFNGQPYWILTAKALQPSLGRCEIDCTPRDTIEVDAPYGYSGLTGSPTNYGGLSAQNITNNAVQTWITNGYTNINATKEPENLDAIVALDAANLQYATGLVSIPVCGFADIQTEVKSNPTNANGNTFWPCPSGVAETAPSS